MKIDYTDESALFKTISEWTPIRYYSTQIYAIKFIMGEIDAAKRLLRNLEKLGQPVRKVQLRLSMLKSVAYTISKLPIEVTE